jgi:lysozyme
MNDYELSENFFNKIKKFEGLHDGDLTKIGLQPKLCPAGYWTIGYGHCIITMNGRCHVNEWSLSRIKELKMDLIDEIEADCLLRKDVKYYVNLVNIHLEVQVEQHQFEAIVLFVYNCGISETLFDMVNTRVSLPILLSWWRTRYVTANGIKLKGLQMRRLFESNLFAYGW